MEKVIGIVFLLGFLGYFIFMKYFELAISAWYIGFLIPAIIVFVFFIIVKLVYGKEFNLIIILIPIVAGGLFSMGILFFNDVLSRPNQQKKVLLKEKYCIGCESNFPSKNKRAYVIVEIEEIEFKLKIPWENRNVMKNSDSIDIKINTGLFGIRFINSWELIAKKK